MTANTEKQRTIPYEVTPETMPEVGDVLYIKFDDFDPDHAKERTCYFNCGDIFQVIVLAISNARLDSLATNRNAPRCFKIQTNPVGSDVTSQRYTTFYFDSEEKRWKSRLGSGTCCTLTAIGHINNVPIECITKMPYQAPDED
ncbi:MAG: hypothetical protein WC289_05840 [Patescibacteria group bacterium]|jgi:hypothetical protein